MIIEKDIDILLSLSEEQVKMIEALKTDQLFPIKKIQNSLMKNWIEFIDETNEMINTDRRNYWQ